MSRRLFSSEFHGIIDRSDVWVCWYRNHEALVQLHSVMLQRCPESERAVIWLARAFRWAELQGTGG